MVLKILRNLQPYNQFENLNIMKHRIFTARIFTILIWVQDSGLAVPIIQPDSAQNFVRSAGASSSVFDPLRLKIPNYSPLINSY